MEGGGHRVQADLLRGAGMCNVGQKGGSVHVCVHQVQGLAGCPSDLCITVPHKHPDSTHP